MAARRSAGSPGDPALDAVAGEGERLLVGALGDGEAFDPDAEPGHVHHREHVLEAAILLADQRADGPRPVAEGEHGGGAAVDAELVLERDAAHVVVAAGRAARIGQELGHDEQRDALHPLGGIGRPGQDQVDDVGRQVVIAVGDEDLLPGDEVVVAAADGARLDRGQVRAGLRLGQAHGAGPFARDQLGQIELLLLVRAMEQDRLDRTLGQQRAEAEAHVGRVPHLLHGGVDEPGQSLAAPLRVEHEPVPAGLDEGLVGRLPARRGAYLPVDEPGAIDIAGAVQRRQDVGGELRGLLEDGIDEIGRRVLEAGQLADSAKPGELDHDEAHVGDRGGIAGHDSFSTGRRYALACSSSRVSSGTSLNRSPTRP